MGVYKAWSEGARGRNEERKDTSELADTIMAWEEIATFHGNPFRESYPTIRCFYVDVSFPGSCTYLSTWSDHQVEPLARRG